MSGFEIFGVLFAIPAAIVQLNQSVQNVRDLYQAFVENDTYMTRVTMLYNDLSQQIQHVSQELQARAHLLPPSSLAVLSCQFQVVEQRIHRASSQLRDIATRDATTTQVVRFLRSRHVRQDWQALETNAYQLMHSIVQLSVPCTNIDIVVNYFRHQEQRILQELNNIGQSFFLALSQHPVNRHTSQTQIQVDTMHTLHLTSPTPHTSLRDIDMNFTSTIYSPKNPPYVLADFANPNAPESQLLSLIMRDGTNSLPDIYCSRKIELTGKGGRGKTCILRSLCENPTIMSKFTGAGKGGIYYMNLGHNPGADDVRRKLYEIVECSGGTHLRESLLSENISFCIYILVQWFKHKDTLFLIDEAYDETEFGASVTEQLVALSTTSSSSAVVFSRQKSRFSLGEKVTVYPEADSGSRRLLLRSAEFDPKEIHDVTTYEAIDRIVDICHGNIRLLGQAGVCYKHLCVKGQREAAWTMLADKLRSRLGDGEDDNEAQDALINEILDALQAGIGKVLKTAPSIHQLYRALHAVKTREWIPICELCAVWGLECGECVMVAEVLLRGRLCRISERVIDGVVKKGVEIHDCLWAYMCREASKDEAVALTS